MVADRRLRAVVPDLGLRTVVAYFGLGAVVANFAGDGFGSGGDCGGAERGGCDKDGGELAIEADHLGSPFGQNVVF
jgi:hypothetical protein